MVNWWYLVGVRHWSEKREWARERKGGKAHRHRAYFTMGTMWCLLLLLVSVRWRLNVNVIHMHFKAAQNSRTCCLTDTALVSSPRTNVNQFHYHFQRVRFMPWRQYFRSYLYRNGGKCRSKCHWCFSGMLSLMAAWGFPTMTTTTSYDLV